MISLCAPTFDISGQLISATGRAILLNASRRANRVATLDGSAVLVDSGWSAADLTYQLRIPDVTGTNHLAITRFMTYHSTAVLATERGCYNVLLSGLTTDKTTTVVIAEVLEDLS